MATLEAEEEITGGRSSSASHYSSEFATATVGTTENDFYGIPLSTDLTGADTNDLVGLGALLFAVVVVKPLLDRVLCGGNDDNDDETNETKKKRSRGNDAGRGGGTAASTLFSIVFWSAALVAAFRLKEVALYPLLSTVVFTRTSYPYLVLISHCLSSLCGYRTERETRDRKKGGGGGGDNLPHYLESFCFTFFCYGFGGSILSDLLMGIPVTAFGHPRIVPCYVLCYLLIYHSPLDLAYRALTGNTFLNYFVAAMEAVDGVTTPMGRVSRSARELSNKTVAPVVAGVFAGAGGASLRYAERVVLHDDGAGTRSSSPSSRAALDAGLWRSLGISCVWWYLAVYGCDDAVGVDVDAERNHCSSNNGSDLVRVVAVGGHVVWTLASKSGLLGWTPFGVTHPLGWLIKDVLGGVCLFLARVLRLGPTAQWQPQADGKKKKKKKND